MRFRIAATLALLAAAAVLLALLRIPLQSPETEELKNSPAAGIQPASPALLPEVVWRFEVRGGAIDTTPSIDHDQVFVGDFDGNLYSLDLATGHEIWMQEGSSPLVGKPSVHRGSLVIGDVDGTVLCLEAATGQRRWDVNTKSSIVAAASFYKNRVLVPTIDAKLLCLHIGSGELLWEFEAADQIHAPITVVDDFGILVAACSSKLQVLDLKSGKAVRSLDLPGETVGEIAVRDSLAFAATMRGHATCVDWNQSETNWTVAVDEALPESPGGVALRDETLVVASSDRFVRAFSPSNGKPLWSFGLRGSVVSKPNLDADNVVFGTSRGRVYSLDRRTGVERWHREFGGDFAGSPAVAGSRLVVANGNGIVYCLHAPNGS